MSRLESAVQLLLQAPPGQVAQVYHDLRGIVLDPDNQEDEPVTEEQFAKAAGEAMRKHNEAQLVPAQLEGEESSLICPEAAVEEGYLHPRAGKIFTFDHLKRTASEVGPAPTPSSDDETLRQDIDRHLQTYVADRYSEGVSSVLTQPEAIVFHHVGNKWHLSNFWSGRWRSSYRLDVENKRLTGSIAVQVHYFEDGNVQLNAAKQVEATPKQVDGRSVARQVEKIEDAYHATLDEACNNLAEKAFKALRRPLPLTRQKIDWDKVTSYKLAAELAK